METVCLSEFKENPDNPQIVTEVAIERLVNKLKRIPNGLKANRIAYITDHPSGGRVVISGNKRLRCLKKIYGESGEVPSEWFRDITKMDEAARREFIVTANVIEGQWLADLLLASYTKEELRELMDDGDVAQILAEVPSVQQVAENQELDPDSFSSTMTLTFKITPAELEKVESVLSAVDSDKGKALVAIMKGIRS